MNLLRGWKIKMDYAKEALKLHEELKGKIEVFSRVKVDSREALSLAYTPGVAQPCPAWRSRRTSTRALP